MKPIIRNKLTSLFEELNQRDIILSEVVDILISMRDHSEKNSLVRELGDFIAHSGSKQKGVFFKRVKSFGLLTHWVIQNDFLVESLTVDQRYPKEILDAIKYNLKSVKKPWWNKLSYQPHALLKKINRYMVREGSGDFYLSPDSFGDKKFLRDFGSIATAIFGNAFISQDDLIFDLKRELKSKGFTVDWLSNSDNLDAFVFYSLIAIHEVDIEVFEGKNAFLKIGSSSISHDEFKEGELGEFKLVLHGAVEMDVGNDRGDKTIMFTVFDTSLRVEDWVDQSFLRLSRSGEGGASESVSIEIGSDVKLENRRLVPTDG